MKFEEYDLNGKILRIPIAESYKDCMELIRSDRYRKYGKNNESTWDILRDVFRPFNRDVLFWLRLTSYAGVFYPICRIIYTMVSRKSQIQISPTTKIGYGFYIGHEICMVVNSGTIIGNNVNLSQFLNIGTNKCTPAIIGDNVYIGPMVCIVEDVVIDSNVMIGAGAVVVKSAPENAVIAGVPAKIIKYSDSNRKNGPYFYTIK